MHLVYQKKTATIVQLRRKLQNALMMYIRQGLWYAVYCISNVENKNSEADSSTYDHHLAKEDHKGPDGVERGNAEDIPQKHHERF